jgi:hypothetical protein
MPLIASLILFPLIVVHTHRIFFFAIARFQRRVQAR